MDIAVERAVSPAKRRSLAELVDAETTRRNRRRLVWSVLRPALVALALVASGSRCDPGRCRSPPASASSRSRGATSSARSAPPATSRR